MDPAAVTGVVTAVGGALAAVVGAVALLLRVSSPTSRAVTALRSLWDWVDVHGYTDAVPPRLASAVLRIIDEKGDGP